jgi:hypothetical protein
MLFQSHHRSTARPSAVDFLLATALALGSTLLLFLACPCLYE